MHKSLIIFDLYNTLIVDKCVKDQDLYRVNSIWATIEKAGYPIRFNEVVDAYNETWEIMKIHQKDHFSVNVFELVNIFSQKIKIVDIIYMKKFYEIWAYASLQFPPYLLDHIKDGLEELKQNGKKIALISNTAMTPGCALRFLLKEKGIYDFFDDMIFSDEFGFMKPNMMIFNRILERLKTSAKETVFVGDHEFYDKYGATGAGIDYLYMGPDVDFREVVKSVL